VLGTGIMGAGVVRSLRRAGIDVRAWNRSIDKAERLRDTGAVIAESPHEAVDGADVVMTMLFDSDAVTTVMHDAKPAAGTIWVQSTTVGIDGTNSLRQLAAEFGLVFVDAPVLGTKKPAAEGNLVVLAAGPPHVEERLAPVFATIGSRVLWVGEAGTASRLKLVVNAWVLGMTAAAAQAIALAEALNVDPHDFLNAIKGSATDSAYAQIKGTAMIARDFTPSFGLDGAAKDAHLIAAAAHAAGVPTTFVDNLCAVVDAALKKADGAPTDLAGIYLALQAGTDDAASRGA